VTAQKAALVLGGTGHVGHALLRELLTRGYKVKTLTRQARPPLLAGLDVEVLQGDINASRALEGALLGVDLVVDAAAPYPLYLTGAVWRAAQPDRAAVQRTERLADAALRHGAAFIFISTFTTLSRPASVTFEIEARVRRAAHPYFVTKEAMEAAVLAAGQRGLRAVIVNPTACLGPWDMKPMALGYLPLLLSGGLPAVTPRQVNVVDVRDVARASLAALDAGLFQTPLLIGGHDIRADELTARACALAGKRPPLLLSSARATATAAYWTEWMFSALRQPAPFPSLPALLLCEARATGLGEEQRALGVLPRSLDETLSDAIAWYQAIGYAPR
jgi:dihydroflavonol-4-reductase